MVLPTKFNHQVTRGTEVYHDQEDVIESLADLAANYPSDADDINELLGILTDNEKEKENCKYCTYQYLCAHRKAGEI